MLALLPINIKLSVKKYLLHMSKKLHSDETADSNKPCTNFTHMILSLYIWMNMCVLSVYVNGSSGVSEMRNDTIPLMHPGQLFYHPNLRCTLRRLEFKPPPPPPPSIHPLSISHDRIFPNNQPSTVRPNALVHVIFLFGNHWGSTQPEFGQIKI